MSLRTDLVNTSGQEKASSNPGGSSGRVQAIVFLSQPRGLKTKEGTGPKRLSPGSVGDNYEACGATILSESQEPLEPTHHVHSLQSHQIWF